MAALYLRTVRMALQTAKLPLRWPFCIHKNAFVQLWGARLRCLASRWRVLCFSRWKAQKVWLGASTGSERPIGAGFPCNLDSTDVCNSFHLAAQTKGWTILYLVVLAKPKLCGGVWQLTCSA